MITVDQARELSNTAEIPFPENWKEQMLETVDEQIRSVAGKGRKIAVIEGTVYRKTGNYTKETFYISPEQFSEVAAVLKQNGFGVGEDFRIRFDGKPLTIDIFW